MKPSHIINSDGGTYNEEEEIDFSRESERKSWWVCFQILNSKGLRGNLSIISQVWLPNLNDIIKCS